MTFGIWILRQDKTRQDKTEKFSNSIKTDKEPVGGQGRDKEKKRKLSERYLEEWYKQHDQRRRPLHSHTLRVHWALLVSSANPQYCPA